MAGSGRTVLIAFAAAIMLAVGIAANTKPSPPTPEEQRAAQRVAAYQACSEAVTNRLKAPATATLPSEFAGGVSILELDKTYEVSSYVDSENSFGARIRASFTCTVEDHTDTWRLTHLQIDQ